ncbi:MAG: winged helix-turn-helix transcriptional regulator [Oscillospiraceae bacterium]|nr:winged helix-turn-helix transcriptional regulator [Oscillospiraceae bacterium]
MPEGRLYRSMLLDFYGELLTERQKECYDLHYNDDLSLSEIAEQCGISRQGVWDNIRRASSAMEEIEEKTGLIRRFTEVDAGLHRVLELLETLDGSAAEQQQEGIGIITQEVRGLLRLRE